jgi:hypothetical protein|tara:strand:+ start:293 stop:775 length:483 start_codon:yes stop_codon:yes gene_type:complete
MSLLPKGLELVKTEKEPIPVRICQAEGSGPWFTVMVNPLSVDRFKRLLSKSNPPANVRPNSKAARDYTAKFERTYCKAVIADWSGLTIANLEDLLAGEDMISGDAVDDYRESGEEIEFSLDLATYIYQNSWADKFSNPIFTAIQDGVSEEEEEEDEKNDF